MPRLINVADAGLLWRNLKKEGSIRRHVEQSIVPQNNYPFLTSNYGYNGSAAAFRRDDTRKYRIMLWTIFVILLILWALGMVTGATLNGFIHLLLIIAVVVVLIRIIQGRRPI